MDERLLLAVLLGLTLLAAAWAPVWKKERVSKKWGLWMWLFMGVLAVALPVWRWRSLVYNGEINVDEGSAIAIALKYMHDPVPWRSVDGITSGPLSTWISLWAPLLGMKITYVTLRVTGIVLMWLCAFGMVLSLKELVGRRLAFLVSLPAAFLLMATLNLDFLYFAMEYQPMTISVWVIYLILRQRRRPDRWKAFLIGVLTGALPFTKLQSAPAGVYLFAVSALVIGICQRRRHLKAKVCDWAALAAGGLTVPALILVPVALGGAWSEFLNFYLFCGASYKNTTSQVPIFTFLMLGNVDFGFYIATLAIFSMGVFYFLRTWRNWAVFKEAAIGLGLTAVYFGIVLYSVLRSGFAFPHYLILLVYPALLLFAWLLRISIKFSGYTADRSATVFSRGVMGILLVQVIGIAFGYSNNAPYLKNWGEEKNGVVPTLLQLSKPGDSMAIWGWCNKLHAFSGIRPSTRFIGTSYVTDPSPNYNRHRELFMQDLRQDRPRLFLDAIDEFRWPTWPQGAAARHTMLPELADWVRQNYTLAAQIQTAPSRLPVQIFVRKDP